MKKRHIAIGILAVLGCLSFAAGCGETAKYEFPYENITPEMKVEITTDEAMNIDGVKESAYGENSISFTETSSGIKVTTWAYLGTNGLYLYSEADDKNVYHSDEREFYENDSIEYYIDPRPDYSLTVEALSAQTQARSDCIQVRINALGQNQTWYGRYTGKNAYPWVRGYVSVLTAAKVDGTLNQANGTQGYSTEAFIPWKELGYSEKPAAIGVMPAFNNINNREDTSRTWFTVKGMNHAQPTGYARVEEGGFVDIGLNNTPAKALTATADDSSYSNKVLTLSETTEQNEATETRATLKAALWADGVYFLAVVNDKVYTKGSDGLWSNDGIEFVIDSKGDGGENVFTSDTLRVGVDVDGGIETDICVDGYGDYVPSRRAAFAKVSVGNFEGVSNFGYQYTYVYEVMVPYATLGLSKMPNTLSFAWAVKTPNETVYIYDRCDRDGKMEGQDWLWADMHYPQNPDEFYELNKFGITGDSIASYQFPEWTAWENLAVQADAKERYNYRGYAANNGLYINVVQYVDSYLRGGAEGDWSGSTHIEMEIWQGDIGWGWGGTYFAFFMDGSSYVNNDKGILSIEYRTRVRDRGENSEGYRYEISYEIFLEFTNNLGSTDGPYAYVQFMSYTPGEGSDGYENATTITKDGSRILWLDDCNSYIFSSRGIIGADERASADANSTVYSYKAKAGEVFVSDNKKLYSRALNTLAVIDGQTLETEGTYSASILHSATARAGIVFGYSAETGGESYYYFYTRKSDNTVGLAKFVNGTETVVYSNYLSASFNYNQAYPFKVELKDGNYYCTFWNTLYVIEKSELSGSEIGFRSDVSGSQFFNVSVTGSVALTTADTVIFGHSYMELWENSAVDLASVTGIGTSKNVAVSGSVAEDWSKLVDGIVSYQPKIGIYMIGINDLFRGISAQTVADTVESTLVAIKNGLPEFRVVLLAVNHCNSATYLASQITNINGLYRGLAEKYSWILFADVEYAFCDAANQPVDTWFTDGLHPTAEGYTQKIVPEISKALNGNVLSKVEWKDWADCTVRSDAQTRYDYRGYAASDGLYLNVVQYVSNYTSGSVGGDWTASTHIEMEIWQGDFGYGWNGTYVAFFLDESYYINNNSNVTDIEYVVTVTDRGAEYADGYRYMISYEIYIGFPNNVGSQDGPYAFVKFMSLTPGENSEGYENATTIAKDVNRTLWTDQCNSCELRAAGVVAKDYGS